MKTPLTSRSIALFAASLSAVVGLTLAMSLSSGAADAPRKGAERLGPTLTREVAARPPASTIHDNCDSCTTTTRARFSDTAKGAETLQAGGRPITRVATHGCGGCSTTFGVKGHGKLMTSTVTHACAKASMASANCCR